MYMDKVCYIVAAGDWYGDVIQKREQDLVIAVDGGYDHVLQMGIVPDITVGDFDSVQAALPDEHVIRLNPVKDETDTLYAIGVAKERGYRNIFIYGGTGGSRLSHTLANVQTLLYYKDLFAVLVDKEEAVFLLHDAMVRFSQACEGYLSVFSITEKSYGVTERGLKYEIENATLSASFPVGVSNEFLGIESSISVEKGALLVAMGKEYIHEMQVSSVW